MNGDSADWVMATASHFPRKVEQKINKEKLKRCLKDKPRNSSL
jgi:hypothetical protein